MYVYIFYIYIYIYLLYIYIYNTAYLHTLSIASLIASPNC